MISNFRRATGTKTAAGLCALAVAVPAFIALPAAAQQGPAARVTLGSQYRRYVHKTHRRRNAGDRARTLTVLA